MNKTPQKKIDHHCAQSAEASDFEDTLHLIANLPAPQGLEDRVQAALLKAPRSGRVLPWPAALRPESGWMRTAAAAAIVFVVAGGGWGVYSRVQSGQPARGTVVPPHVAAPAFGFSSAGAMRTPQTLNGPVVPAPQPAHSAAKAPAKPAPAAVNQGKTAAAKKAAQPGSSSAK